jgi:hypothetical protein
MKNDFSNAMAKARWPVLVALLWVGTRSTDLLATRWSCNKRIVSLEVANHLMKEAWNLVFRGDSRWLDFQTAFWLSGQEGPADPWAFSDDLLLHGSLDYEGALFEALQHGRIKAWGEQGDGPVKEIPAVDWDSLRIFDNGEAGNMFGIVHYSKVRIERLELVELFPPAVGPFHSTVAEYPLTVEGRRSGAPGRPSSMHLVAQELDRRVGSEEGISGSVRDVAGQLSDWLRKNYAHEPQLTPKSISNKLASRIREGVAARN